MTVLHILHFSIVGWIKYIETLDTPTNGETVGHRGTLPSKYDLFTSLFIHLFIKLHIFNFKELEDLRSEADEVRPQCQYVEVC